MRKLLEEFGLIVVAVLVILTVAVTAAPISKDVKDTENKILNSAYENYQKQGSAAVPYDEDNSEFVLTVNKGTGIKAVSGAGTYRKGDQITVVAEVKIGYTFAGWTGDLESQQVEFKFTMPAGDVNLTANAIVNTYTIKYDGNGADGGTTASSAHTYNIEKGLTANGYTRAGCTFAGWNTKADGTGTNYSDEAVVKNLALGGEITLYAQWEGAFAVYSDDDQSLMFYNDTVPVKNRVYKGKLVTEVYTGIELLNATAASGVSWNPYVSSIKTVDVVDEIKPVNMAYWFNNMKSCTSIDLSNLDTSKNTSLKGTFYDCTKLVSLNLNGFDTSKVKNMQNAFRGCKNLEQLDVSQFNTSLVTTMYAAFMDCSKLKVIDVSNFDTSKVTTMQSMFNNCTSVEKLNTTNWNTANVTNMGYLFQSCSALTEADVSNFNTAKVTSMQGMFRDCVNILEIDVSGFQTSKVTNMNRMFKSCLKVETLDVSDFDTSLVTDMTSMFDSCERLLEIDASGFNTGKVTSMSHLFNKCASLESLNVSSFNTQNVTNMYAMFNNCGKLLSVDVSGFNTQNVTDMGCMFSYCGMLKTIDLSEFDTRNVTNLRSMFNSCSSLETVDVSNFNTEKVTSMAKMFVACGELTSLDLSSFDTSNITEKYHMLSACSKLQRVMLSDKFHFIGEITIIDKNEAIEDSDAVEILAEDFLPTPKLAHIPGATGKWYNLETGAEYAPAEIPNNTAATYIAVPIKEYNVTLNKGTGISTLIGAGTYHNTNEVVVEAVANIGYSFSDWSGDLASSDNPYSFTMPAKNITLTANAKANTYIIKYYGNGADGGNTAVSNHTYGEEKTLTDNEFAKENYVFRGWNTKADGSGTAYTDGQMVINLALGGEVTLYAQWTEIVIDQTTGIAKAIDPPIEETQANEIPKENLPEMISFNFGTFETVTDYIPGEDERVKYSYTTTRPPVSRIKLVYTYWHADDNGNYIAPVKAEISMFNQEFSDYVVYNNNTGESRTINGITADALVIYAINPEEEDTLENAIYMAAYYNKVDGTSDWHVAKWNGTNYVFGDYDSDIMKVSVFEETKTAIKTVQVIAPSASTEYVYIPSATMKAEKGMTWEEWLASDYNTTGETEPIIKTSDFEDVKYTDTIMESQGYGFYRNLNTHLAMVLDGDLVDQTYFVFEEGMSWAEFIDSKYNIYPGSNNPLFRIENGFVYCNAETNSFTWLMGETINENDIITYPTVVLYDMFGNSELCSEDSVLCNMIGGHTTTITYNGKEYCKGCGEIIN